MGMDMPMDSLVLLLAVAGVVVVAVLVVVASRKKQGPAPKLGDILCEPRSTLFSPAERSFLGVLEQAVAGEYKVFGKVRLGDLVQPAGSVAEGRKTGLRDQLREEHVDFVLCTPDSLGVVAAVLLDDASQGRAGRNGFVGQALTSAGVPVLRFPARQEYALAAVKKSLAEHLGPKGAEAAGDVPAEPAEITNIPIEPAPRLEPQAAAPEAAAATAEEIAPPAGAEAVLEEAMPETAPWKKVWVGDGPEPEPAADEFPAEPEEMEDFLVEPEPMVEETPFVPEPAEAAQGESEWQSEPLATDSKLPSWMDEPLEEIAPAAEEGMLAEEVPAAPESAEGVQDEPQGQPEPFETASKLPSWMDEPLEEIAPAAEEGTAAADYLAAPEQMEEVRTEPDLEPLETTPEEPAWGAEPLEEFAPAAEEGTAAADYLAAPEQMEEVRAEAEPQLEPLEEIPEEPAWGTGPVEEYAPMAEEEAVAEEYPAAPEPAEELQPEPEPQAAALEAASAEPVEEPAPAAEEAAEEAEEAEEELPPSPACPACSRPMVKRQAKKGNFKGQWFWTCTGFPECRKIMAAD